MVFVIPRDKLNELNIDTVERAIVLATLGLKMALRGENEEGFSNDKIKINTEQEGTSKLILKLDVSLPYNSYVFTQRGGKMLSAIRSFIGKENTSITSLIDFTIVPTIPIPPAIPISLDTINSLEAYLFYYVSVLSASLNTTRNRIVKIDLVDNQSIRVDDVTGTPIDSKSEIRMRLKLPMNAKKWLEGRNLVECVERIPVEPIDNPDSNIVSILLDNILLTDEQLLVD
jgi:hypothetical protein